MFEKQFSHRMGLLVLKAIIHDFSCL